MALPTAYFRLFDIPTENDNNMFYRHRFLTICVFYSTVFRYNRIISNIY